MERKLIKRHGGKRVISGSVPPYHSGRSCSCIETLLCPAVEQEEGGDLQCLIVLIPQLQMSVA